jgi:hypothetical protein
MESRKGRVGNMRFKNMLAGGAGVLSALLSVANAGPNDTDWIPLFNRADLKDWDIKFTGHQLNDNYKNTFYVKDSLMMVDYTGYTGFSNEWGHMAYKVRPFSYYILRAEYSPGANQVSGGPSWAIQNNGLMLHAQSMASMTLNQDYPISMETQLLGAKNGTGATMNLCTPGTAFYTTLTGGSVNTTHCINASNSPGPAADAWAWGSVLVMSDSIIRHYNKKDPTGTPVLTYYRPVYYAGNVLNPPAGTPANGTRLTGGYITVQAESAPYRFRRIELVNLEGCMTVGNPNYKSYFVHHDAAACNAVNVGQAPGLDAGFSVGPAFASFAPAREPRRIEIFGSDGRLAASLEVPAGARDLRMPELRGGVYFAKLAARGGSVTRRLAVY